MPVTARWVGQALVKTLNKEIDWDTDTIKVSLHTGAVPDQDVVDYFDDVAASEVAAGNGYTAGGTTLANKTIGYTAATNVIKLDADDAAWPNSTISATFAIIYDASPATNATRPIMGIVDFGGTVASTAAAFTITWDAAGIFTITVAA